MANFPLINMENWWKLKKMWYSHWITWQIDEKLKKCKTPTEYHGKLLQRPQICPLRRYGNSPLSYRASALWGRCFALTPLLQPSLQAGHWVPLTMCDLWMTCLLCHFICLFVDLSHHTIYITCLAPNWIHAETQSGCIIARLGLFLSENTQPTNLSQHNF